MNPGGRRPVEEPLDPYKSMSLRTVSSVVRHGRVPGFDFTWDYLEKYQVCFDEISEVCIYVYRYLYICICENLLYTYTYRCMNTHAHWYIHIYVSIHACITLMMTGNHRVGGDC